MKPYKHMTKKELFDEWKKCQEDIERVSSTLAVCNDFEDPRGDCYSQDDIREFRVTERNAARRAERIGSEIKCRYGVDVFSLWYCPVSELSETQKQFLDNVK